MNGLARFGALIVGLCLCISGCGGPEVGQVKGKVTFRGQPVQEGLITFSNPETGYQAEANIKSDGTYEMETLEGGIVVGDYSVAIAPLTVLDTSDPHTPPMPMPKPAPNIPQQYRDIITSPFKVTVKPGENEPHNFDMVP